MAINLTVRVKVRAGLKLSWCRILSFNKEFIPRTGLCGFRRNIKSQTKVFNSLSWHTIKSRFLIAPSMHVNGPAVKLVATGSWRKWFLLSFQGGQDLSCYDKAVLV